MEYKTPEKAKGLFSITPNSQIQMALFNIGHNNLVHKFTMSLATH